MTREVAIKAIQDFIGWFKEDSLIRKSLEMAISALNSLEEVYAKGYDDGFAQAEVNYENDKALSQEPTVTSTDEPMTMVYPTIVCDDAVSRQSVLEQAWTLEYPDSSSEKVVSVKDIEKLPSVTQKSGKWIDKDLRKEEYVLIGKCSVCGQVRVIDKYCANCGCSMVEPQESEVRNETDN